MQMAQKAFNMYLTGGNFVGPLNKMASNISGGNGGGSKDAACSVLAWLGRGRVRTKGGWRVCTASFRVCPMLVFV